MNVKAQALLGTMTAILFGSIGGVLFSEGRTQIGGILIAIGVFRAAVLIRQIQSARAAAKER
ncbi:MAG: hypothetical protein ABMB14_13290 [Myxococcota bacterium]